MSGAPKTFGPAEFRKELVKVMPGYDWTVHRQHHLTPHSMEATGTQSSGMNRLSTLRVTRHDHGIVQYEVKSAGFGLRAPWLHKCRDASLKSALRGLQQHYERQAALYRGHANALQNAREPAKEQAA